MLKKLSHHRIQSRIMLGITLMVMFQAMPAMAQQPTFDRVNQTILHEIETIPTLYKQMTILIGVVTTMAGIHGLYKGMTDSRSPSIPYKKLSLIVIGGMMLYMGGLAYTTELSIFGRSASGNIVNWTNTTSKINVFR